MARIGLVPMAAKPFHAGHSGLIHIASEENDVVHLYVSLSDREQISGAAMTKIWHELIEPTLPGNVEVTYGGISPVGHVYKVLGDADKEGSTDTFTVYSDPTDIKANFKTLEKYAGNLLANKQIILRGIERSSTVDVSGTQMRQWLDSGDKASFISKLPKELDGDRIWDTLTTMKPGKPAPKKKAKASPKVEGLLRSYVRLLLAR